MRKKGMDIEKLNSDYSELLNLIWSMTPLIS